MEQYHKLQQLPGDLYQQIEHTLSIIAEANIPTRLQQLEERVEQLYFVEEMATKLEQVCKNMWTTKRVLTSQEAATYLGLSNSYIYKLTSTHKIPHYKPNGKVILFDRLELEKWAFQNGVNPLCNLSEVEPTFLTHHEQ